MVHILVHHKVEDFKKWKPIFDKHSSFRSENGSKGGKIFQSADNPNDLFVLLEWESIESLQKFSQSDSLKEAMKESGVVGMPEVYFIKEAAATSK
ncbi:MAG TPA: antibiotic biosynthesis monooxygenase [Ignavibacteriaceae bacterium]|nr:antibiotic biosynthesis monooxygenase [Ignavibacteriaceae bacterium]